MASERASGRRHADIRTVYASAVAVGDTSRSPARKNMVVLGSEEIQTPDWEDHGSYGV